jgi:hemerythrin
MFHPEVALPSMPWSPRYATGIPAIDAQHQRLFEIIQKLQEALEADRAQGETLETTAFLVRYVDEHFRAEEAYMARIGYPDLEEHQELHGRLRSRVQGIRQQVEEAQGGSAMELSTLLFEWLRDHILHDDFSYVRYARDHQAASGD